MHVHDEESKVVVLCDDCAGGLAGVDELTIGGHSSPDCMHCGYIFAGFLEQAHHYRRSDLVKLTARLVLIVNRDPPTSSQGGSS